MWHKPAHHTSHYNDGYNDFTHNSAYNQMDVLVRRLGIPISQAFTLEANLNEHIVSPTDDASGEILTNMRVFESPPRQGCKVK